MEFHRNRDLYMRKHHSDAERLLVRALSALFYLGLAAAAVVAARPRSAPAICCTRARSWRRDAARGSARLPRSTTGGRESHPDVDHPDLAQIAAVAAAAGAALLLAGRGRAMVLCGLALSALGAAGLAAAPSGLGPAGRADIARGRGGRRAGPGGAVRRRRRVRGRPAWVPLAVLAAAPLRPPIAFESGGGFPLALADDGQLGRLLPLYFVLAAAGAGAGLARGPRRTRRRAGRCRGWWRLPAAAFIAFACVSLTWADELEPACRAAAVLHGARSPCSWPSSPGRRSPTGRRARWRADRRSPWRAVFAAVGPLPGRHPRAVLLRPQPGRVQRQLGLLPGDVAVRRPQPLRAPRGAGARACCWWRWRCAGSTCAWACACWWCCGEACSSPTRSRAWWP